MWISKKKHEELCQQLADAHKALEKVRGLPYLVSIERQGRENVFTFARRETLTQIRTMGLWSDDIKSWQESLLE